jgi:hypothetical protein
MTDDIPPEGIECSPEDTVQKSKNKRSIDKSVLLPILLIAIGSGGLVILLFFC